MDPLVIKQRLAIEQLTKGYTNYKKDPKARKTVNYANNLLTRIEGWHDTFGKTHSEILNKITLDSDLERHYFVEDWCTTFEDIYINFKSDIEDFVQLVCASQKNEVPADPRESSSSFSNGDVKLPRISMPNFAGTYEEWTSFRDLFQSLIHNRKTLTNVEKLHYLKSSLTGEAERLLKHIPVTEVNYELAWNILNERYNNEHALLTAQLNRFFSIGSAEECSWSIKNLLDQTTEIIMSIENLKVPNLWDAIVIFLTTQRLSKETRILWEQQMTTSKNPSFKDLKLFLEIRFRALETSNTPMLTKKPITPATSKHLRVFHTDIQLCCVCCKEHHSLRNCSMFINMVHSKKIEVIKRNALCLNCLGKGHFSSNCPSKFRCSRCKGSHHTLLHKDVNLNSSKSESQTLFNGNNINTFNTVVQKEVLLATALVTLESPRGQIVVRALLDQGSQGSFITESAVQQLGLKKKGTQVNIYGIGSTISKVSNAVVYTSILAQEGEKIPIDAFVLDTLTHLTSSENVGSSIWEGTENLQLADPHFYRPGRIDVLLGADVYARILCGEIRQLKGGPIAQKTRLGWIIYGPINQHSLRMESRSLKVQVAIDDLSDSLRRFWEFEDITMTRTLSEEEILCESLFKRNTTRDKNGRYVVRLPFKSEEHKKSLGSSRSIAMASWRSLEKRFERDPQFHKEYSSCIEEYLKLGYMEIPNDAIDATSRPDEEMECKANYLPHHAVFKDSTTTQLRVVFDASRKTSSGISLNDTLLTGPPLLNDLVTVLMNWRLFKFVFVADIAKMYLQIKLHPSDVNFQRIIFRFFEQSNVVDLVLTRVMFGETCSPYLAIRCLYQLAEDEQKEFPEAFEILQKEFFVDDWLSGAITIEEAIIKRRRMCQFLQLGGFKLRKWIANDARLLEDVPEEDMASKICLDINLDEGHKSLGIVWYPSSDSFGYRVKLTSYDSPLTKRQILSDIARLFDPMGWLSPIIIKAKILLQSLWLSGCAWDETLSNDISVRYNRFRNALPNIEQFRIPRWVTIDDPKYFELHGFCDASREAYAAAVYLVTRSDHQSCSQLIIAKTKVAPVRPVSIPRLELCGAVLLAKLVHKVMDSFKIPNLKVWLWTDSTVVLSWLRGNPNRWTVFVANRTTQIYDAVGNKPWNHVPTKENPVDMASRGVESILLMDIRLWLSGPSWLLQSSNFWPKMEYMKETTLEHRKLSVNITTAITSYLDKIINRFSSWIRLIRVTAYCLRFISILKKRKSNRAFLTSVEINSATEFWVKYTQRQDYGVEIAMLLKNQLVVRSKITNLYPFLDGKGVLRVGGRLSNADLTFDEAHPIILPKDSKLSELLVQYIHLLTFHGGATLMLSTMRKKFWLVNGRNVIRYFIFKCNKCFKAKAKISQQLMANLPGSRVTISRPFTHTGIDYCGPINIKDRPGRGCKITKGYIVIFICFAVKAIHIEVVSDLSTKCFWAALKRFIGRRGLCSHIYSDCGTNFVGANIELKRIVAENNKVAEPLANMGITWHFNPPASPHFGGLWEAGVKSIKTHLHRVLGNANLTYEEMTTTLVSIEACLNSRPLCRLNDDPLDTSALTPGHFLIGNTLLAPPEMDLSELNLNRLDRWQRTQRLSQTFWRKWKTEYLARLQQRPKWFSITANPKVGDLCLLQDERLASYRWPLAKIVKLYPGKDGLVRVVSVQVRGNILKRPLHKLAILPSQ